MPFIARGPLVPQLAAAQRWCSAVISSSMTMLDGRCVSFAHGDVKALLVQPDADVADHELVLTAYDTVAKHGRAGAAWS